MAVLNELHFGIVTNNNDPNKRGRIKCKSQSLVSASAELPDWLDPCSGVMVSKKGGALWLPEVGATVELIIDEHDPDDDMPGERFLQNPNIRWRPAGWTDKNGPMPLPADFATANYPNVRGFVTPAGHKILLDDKGMLVIASKDGAIVTFQTNGNVTINNPTLLGSATDLMILGQQFMTLFNAHVHPTGVGPSGPPSPPMTSAHLSQNGHKLG